MGNENLTGTTLGQCELRELLGSGGMGTVYSAWHVHLKVRPQTARVKAKTPSKQQIPASGS